MMTRKQAFQLALAALREKRHHYSFQAHAAALGLEFGKKAQAHYNKLSEAMTILELEMRAPQQPSLPILGHDRAD